MTAASSSARLPYAHLAEFAATLRFEDLPPTTVGIVKLMILDSLGTALAATTIGDGCPEVIGLMQELGGGPALSSILGTCARVSAPNAAFANGALVHALNFDPAGADTGHLGVVCLAAPLAVSEAKGGVTGREFIAASAVACEVTARITAALVAVGVPPSDRFLSGQLLSYFGAAAGSGRVIGLDPARMRSCFGLALMQAAGSRQVVMSGDPPAKAIYGAFPNQAGVLAALLSRDGLGADCDALGEPAGLFPMIYGGNRDEAVLLEGLGSRFTLEKVAFKPWATSNHLHPFIEAAIVLHREGLRASDVARVEIVVDRHLLPWCEPLEARRRPANAASAANSLVFCVAKALSGGNVLLSDFTGDGLSDATARSLAERSTYRCADDGSKGIVIVTTTAGQIVERRAAPVPPHSSGASSRALLEAKFRDCCAHAGIALSGAQATEIIHMVDHLEEIEDISALARRACGLTPWSDE